MSIVDPALETEQVGVSGVVDGALTLPPAEVSSFSDEDRAHVQRSADLPNRLIMTPVLFATVLLAAIGFGLAGWQITRTMNGDERISIVSWVELLCAVGAAAGLVAWTWIVVENARRLLALSSTTEPPSPSHTALAWATPLVVASAAVGAIVYLQRRLNQPDFEDTSPVPLAVACVSLIVTLFVSYRPLYLLSGIMRRLGGGVGDLARWVWVPISLAIVGGFTLFGLRAGGAYGDDFEGIAPAWALGVVFIPPVVIVLLIAWRGGRMVEDVVRFAYDRRSGLHPLGAGRSGLTLFALALRADARPPIHRDVRKRIRLVPAASIVRLAVMISVAALTLISVVGALVMFLFWREATDGSLIPSQRQRAWNALGGLQDLERLVATGAVAVATIWAFVTVTNARVASGRRRNPFIAAVAWPGAAYAIWWIADRYDDTSDIETLVLRFGLQALALYVPFFLLERAAVAVGARRSPLRLTYALGVVLMVHIQGLGGLATLIEETDIDRFGRIAGYLALAAVLELIATVAITEASGLIGDASSSVADKHNFLADQRAKISERAAVNGSVVPGTGPGDDVHLTQEPAPAAAPAAAAPAPAAPAPVPQVATATPTPMAPSAELSTPSPAPSTETPAPSASVSAPEPATPPAQEPVAQAVPEPVAPPVSEPVAPPVSEPVAPPVSETVAPPVPAPVAQPVPHAVVPEPPRPIEPVATPAIAQVPMPDPTSVLDAPLSPSSGASPEAGRDDSFELPRFVPRPIVESSPVVSASTPPTELNGG